MNEIANILGLYKFNAFDFEEYGKARKIFFICRVLLSALLLVLYFKYYLPLFYSFFEGIMNMPSSGGFTPQAAPGVAIITFIILGFFVCFWFGSDRLDKSLAKVNADHRLNDFDKEIISKYSFVIRSDIEANGYFSAVGYWELYNCNENNKRESIAKVKEKAEKDKLRVRYPGVFKE